MEIDEISKPSVDCPAHLRRYVELHAEAPHQG